MSRERGTRIVGGSGVTKTGIIIVVSYKEERALDLAA